MTGVPPTHPGGVPGSTPYPPSSGGGMTGPAAVPSPYPAAVPDAASVPSAYPGGPAIPPTAPPNKPLWQKKGFIIPAAVVVLLIVVAAVNGAGGAGQTRAVVAATTSPVTQPASAPAPSDDAGATQAATTFTMPDVTGMVLQDAQDKLQALGSYLIDQQDASGQNRLQVNDSNWRVCTQQPAPGTQVLISAKVTLASVKLAETCPGAGPAPASTAKAAPPMTKSQEQAVRSAQSYLDFTAFSKTGLIKQLKYEGFTQKQAEYGAKAVGL